MTLDAIIDGLTTVLPEWAAIPFFGANRGGGMRKKKFSALMRRVEARRLELGMNKTELAAELGTTDDAVRAWMTGRTIGRPETVQKLKAFLAST